MNLLVVLIRINYPNMKQFFLAFILLFINQYSYAQDPVTVFKSGEQGYEIFRIPAIVKAPNGDLLAFCEGRVNGSADFGDIDIVLKRSVDGGKTWSGFQVVAENGELQAGNPAPVFDLMDPDFPEGRLFLFYNTGNRSETNNRLGKGVREVYYVTSTDLGASWSDPVNITLQVHKPNNPEFNPAYVFEEDDWRSYALTPGHALQLEFGDKNGRLYVPANHSSRGVARNWGDYNAHAFYSDDHGRSFKLAESVDLPGTNESIALQYPDGMLQMNIRNQAGDQKLRIIAESSDFGHSWDTVYFHPELIDPICQASVLLARKDSESMALFSNNNSSRSRDHLVLLMSRDKGITWDESLYIDGSLNMEENFNSYTAYSDLVQVDENTAGVLYERKDYAEICFRGIHLEW